MKQEDQSGSHILFRVAAARPCGGCYATAGTSGGFTYRKAATRWGRVFIVIASTAANIQSQSLPQRVTKQYSPTP